MGSTSVGGDSCSSGCVRPRGAGRRPADGIRASLFRCTRAARRCFSRHVVEPSGRGPGPASVVESAPGPTRPDQLRRLSFPLARLCVAPSAWMVVDRAIAVHACNMRDVGYRDGVVCVDRTAGSVSVLAGAEHDSWSRWRHARCGPHHCGSPVLTRVSRSRLGSS